MLMSDGIGTGARRGLLGLLVAAALAGAARSSWAQPGSGEIAEDEMYGYVGSVFEAYNACDISWFRNQLSPSAGIQVTYANGQVDSFTPDQYVAKLRAVCRPYQFVKWDQTGFQVTTSGPAASAVWKMGWGGRQGLSQRGSSALVFTNRVEVAREERGLQITGLELRADELIVGAEKAYWSQASGSGILDLAIRFYNDILIRMRDWRLKYRGKSRIF